MYRPLGPGRGQCDCLVEQAYAGTDRVKLSGNLWSGPQIQLEQTRTEHVPNCSQRLRQGQLTVCSMLWRGQLRPSLQANEDHISLSTLHARFLGPLTRGRDIVLGDVRKEYFVYADPLFFVTASARRSNMEANCCGSAEPPICTLWQVKGSLVDIVLYCMRCS